MHKPSILVTGANGQLGLSLKKIAVDYPQYQFHFIQREALDLSQPTAIEAYCAQHHFDNIIHCAASTTVDKAEQELELADTINHLAVQQLSRIAKARDTTLIHISTDYVFDGTQHRPYSETEATNPQSVYGASKLKGEKALQKIAPKGCIIRTSWVYSEFGKNFLKTMLNLGTQRKSLSVIFDQVGTPTYATDLARAIMSVIEKQAFEQQIQPEIYHYSNEGVCSWYDFATAIFEMAQIQCNLTPIETKDYPTPAQRPHYSLLNKAKIKHDYALDIPYWRDSVEACLNTLANT